MGLQLNHMEDCLRQFITAVAVKRNVEVPLDLDINDPDSLAALQVNYNLNAEEDKELLEEIEMAMDTGHGSRVLMLKEIIDKLYVTIHLAVTFGFNLEPAWNIIHQNNMSKVEKGTIREDGKLLKPADYVKPDLSKVA